MRNVPPSQQHLPINLQLGEHPNFFSEILPVNLTTARPLQRLFNTSGRYPLKEDFGSPEQGGSYRLRVAVDLILKGRQNGSFGSFDPKNQGGGGHSQRHSLPRWLSSLPDRKIHKGKGQDLHTGTSQPSKLPLKKRLDAFQQHVDSLKETIRKGKEKETRRSRRTQHLALATVSPSSRGKCIYPKNHWTLIYYLYCLCFSAGFWDSKPPALTSHEYEYTLERLDELIPKKIIVWFRWFLKCFFLFHFLRVFWGERDVSFQTGVHSWCHGWRVGACWGSSSLLSTFKDLLLYESEQVRGLGWCL